MKRFWPRLFIVAGLFLLLGGFVYDVIFAGIPYQDPTPEMSARFSRHALIASIIRWCGVGSFFFGVMAGIRRRGIRRSRPPRGERGSSPPLT
ncbi:MAG: hypothetical protein KUA37_14820 [Desulfomicrobium sp.]|nr:hypothetical protein [Pseudomonadota bacterium]MBU4595623.1 hypothetical protein [Pseudomonadota bacterium]MBV1713257.1 hypothetical protein [Desulfomicrobium sp.]